MSIYEYDEKKVMQLLREEAIEIGLEQGREQGLEQGREQAREEAYQIIISLCIEYGENQETAKNRLMQKYGLSSDEAGERVCRYWNH
jgi:flagellar biosynthesis/type III secretory pathway protein FliH